MLETSSDFGGVGGLDCSIGNGLDYSVEGASFVALRDSLSWSGGAPSTQAVRNSFAAWEAPNLSSNLVSIVTFNERLEITATDDEQTGAEIDVMATDLTGRFGPGVTGGTGGMAMGASLVGGNLVPVV